MPVTMNKGDGVTVFTVTSDPKCAWPHLCQILKTLCYNPLCCSVPQHLRKVQDASQSALGATQIMVGVFNICLAIILGNYHPNSWQFMEDWYPVLLGLLYLTSLSEDQPQVIIHFYRFAVFGTMSILSEKYPSLCLVIASVIANLAGVAFSIAAITLYGYNFLRMGADWLCQRNDWNYWYGRLIKISPTQSVEEIIMWEKCLEARTVVRQAFFVFPAIMSVLELCLVISCAVLGIKTLVRGQKEINKSTDDSNLYKLPLLKEVTTIT